MADKKQPKKEKNLLEQAADGIGGAIEAIGDGIPEITEETAGIVLNSVYDSALQGIPQVSKSVDELAADYYSAGISPLDAAKNLANVQIAKCGTSGFVTGLGGAITLPVAIPANISSVLYIQLRMIAAVAKIGGYDI